ncbi:MAG TPA: exodeoxyribonuclease VII large subunit, partial [Casimicrobiaceae bacterium]|nr:exodeoxyribonuclease VII large subunit [Casimicrobiaceae bacterium]
MTTPGALPASGTPVMPVGRFVAAARLAIERAIGLVWVGGEVSGFVRAASGHCYFTLKDAEAQVRCVLWRQKAQLLDLRLADGMAIEVRATPTIYEARGDFQLVVDAVRLAGRGALYEEFARLKARLDAAGWFAAARKRALPRFPKAVGLVTSPQGAALHDMLTTVARRWPALRVVLYPTPVQGDGAAVRIAEAIRIANARAEVDVLVVARGGGSIEDLWAFNEEAVARAVFESALPVVSAVGHETDFTICDFVADVRAPTPTGAAAIVAPDGEAIAGDVGVLAGRLARAGRHAIGARVQRVDLAARGLVHPRARLDAQRARLLAVQEAAVPVGLGGGARSLGQGVAPFARDRTRDSLRGRGGARSLHPGPRLVSSRSPARAPAPQDRSGAPPMPFRFPAPVARPLLALRVLAVCA